MSGYQITQPKPQKPKEGQALSDIRPKVTAQWHPSNNSPLSAADVKAGSNFRAWWLCGICGHEWTSFVYNRLTDSCPACSGAHVRPGTNDLATLRPEIAQEWHTQRNGSLTAQEVTEFSVRRVWWQCSNGHEWAATVANRTAAGSKCPYCAGKKVLLGFNDLATLRPDLASDWHPTKNGAVQPTDVTRVSGKLVWWRCSLGHEWRTRIAARTFMGSGCPVCSGREVLAGFNDLGSLCPAVASEWHPTRNTELDPSGVTAKTSRRAWWLCPTCSHEWISSIGDRVSKQTRCPECAGSNTSIIEANVRSWFLHGPTLVDVEEASNVRLPIPWRHRTYMRVDIVGRLSGTDTPVVIEYDGGYWHSKPDVPQRDHSKTTSLLAAGYAVVRIREGSLPELNIQDDRLLQVRFQSNGHFDTEAIAELVERVEYWLECMAELDRMVGD